MMRYLTVLCILVLFSQTMFAQRATRAERPIAFKNVTLIDGWNVVPRTNTTLVVQGKKILMVGKPFEIVVPENAVSIDLEGKYIIPGLIDVDTRFQSKEDLAAMFAAGITTANILTPTPEQIPVMQEGDSTKIPDVYTTVPLFVTPQNWQIADSSNIDTLLTTIPSSAEEARALVQNLASKGLRRIVMVYDDMEWCGVKQQLRADSLIVLTMIQEAKKQKMFVGIQSPKIQFLQPLLDAGVSAITGGILDVRFSSDAVHQMSVNPTYYVASLVRVQCLAEGSPFFTQIAKDSLMKKMLLRDVEQLYAKIGYIDPFLQICNDPSYVTKHRSVAVDNCGAMAKNYVPIPLGTGLSTLPGIGVHLELENMVKAGLTPMQAIVSATVISAEYLGIRAHTGFVYRDFQADFLILDKNPIEDIRNTRSISQVVKNGKIYDVSALRHKR